LKYAAKSNKYAQLAAAWSGCLRAAPLPHGQTQFARSHTTTGFYQTAKSAAHKKNANSQAKYVNLRTNT
jgi:hypothetical protein